MLSIYHLSTYKTGTTKLEQDWSNNITKKEKKKKKEFNLKTSALVGHAATLHM